ncbi:MAG: PilZ domain-containing protein, partial [Desulfovibrionaceae bacterium]
MSTTTDSERRRAARFEMNLPADLTVTDARGGRELLELLTRDVCAGGVFLSTGDPLPPDTEVEIHLRVPLDRVEGMRGKHTHVRATGQVVRAQQGGMAVRFDVSYQLLPVRPRLTAFVVSHSRLVGELLAEFLRRELGMEAACGALEDLHARPAPRPDTASLILLDWRSLPSLAPIADIEHRLGLRGDQSLLLLFNAEPSRELRLKALHHGLRGVLAYEDDLAEFARGVQAVGRGELWYPRGLLAGARALNTAGA